MRTKKTTLEPDLTPSSLRHHLAWVWQDLTWLGLVWFWLEQPRNFCTVQGRLNLTVFLLLPHNRRIRGMYHCALFLLDFNMVSVVFSEDILRPEKGADSQRPVTASLILLVLINGVLCTVRPIPGPSVLFQNAFIISVEIRDKAHCE